MEQEDDTPARTRGCKAFFKEFGRAICIPGVLNYGMAFFCVKFCVYAFILWLPTFLQKFRGYDNG